MLQVDLFRSALASSPRSGRSGWGMDCLTYVQSCAFAGRAGRSVGLSVCLSVSIGIGLEVWQRKARQHKRLMRDVSPTNLREQALVGFKQGGSRSCGLGLGRARGQDAGAVGVPFCAFSPMDAPTCSCNPDQTRWWMACDPLQVP